MAPAVQTLQSVKVALGTAHPHLAFGERHDELVVRSDRVIGADVVKNPIPLSESTCTLLLRLPLAFDALGGVRQGLQAA